jgi:hypothetical protein
MYVYMYLGGIAIGSYIGIDEALEEDVMPAPGTPEQKARVLKPTEEPRCSCFHFNSDPLLSDCLTRCLALLRST